MPEGDRGVPEPEIDHRTQREEDPASKPLPTANRRTLGLAGVGAAVLFAVVLVIGIVSRVTAKQSLDATTREAAVQTVTAVHPQPVVGTNLVLPARLDAWSAAPVYARSNGYLRRWYVDIGTRVRSGEVLADVETPEVDQQLTASRAALATAQAQLNLAAITASRWTKLLAQNAVSKQDADDRRGDYAAKLAMRNQAQADVDRLRAVTGFQQILAPFDGVLTGRATDIGALIVAGPGAAPLFTVADIGRLRIYVSVPQAYVAAVHTGAAAAFKVPELPGETFHAVIARTAEAVDPQTGAMLVQLVYDNGDARLKPGEYADVTFDLPSASGANDLLRVPADTLLFRKDGTTVAVAGADGKVSIRKVAIATDLGSELQISSGLSKDDWVIDSPNDGIDNGDEVRLQSPDAKADKPHD